mmetsp:Transcript_32793/g.55292  ORF Transcript_32793/g.55292 Transcript_32793/m.55292 type:complete len:387 (-) Transcript_32793:34-1194(-)
MKRTVVLRFSLLLLCLFFTKNSVVATTGNSAHKVRTHVVTGAAGYLAKELCHTILENAGPGIADRIIGLVRQSKLKDEIRYWEKISTHIEVVDMDQFKESLSSVRKRSEQVIVYCVASNFKPAASLPDNSPSSEEDRAKENVRLFEDTIETSFASNVDRIIITSSMAAVRGPGQIPCMYSDGSYFTNNDWNTVSKLSRDSFASSYQWSKMKSEKRAWEIAGSYDQATQFVSMCPSMIFGPIRDASQRGYSYDLMKAWLDGSRKVESRLVVDVRDAALAHYRAATWPLSTDTHIHNKRYIVSPECRLSAAETLRVLQGTARELHIIPPEQTGSMCCDDAFTGGAVPIGAKEVDAAEMLENDLGIICRPVSSTLQDMLVSMKPYLSTS